MRYSIDPALLSLLQQHIPGLTASRLRVTPLAGLTGLTMKVTVGGQHWLARRAVTDIPFISRQREARILRQLSGCGLAPAVIARSQRWLLLSWVDGVSLTIPAFAGYLDEVVRVLTRLHHQPLSGYRLQLMPLLQNYWQCCTQRNYHWQRALTRLQQLGEPRPLRSAVLHMDIHAGNLVATDSGLRLIDWEYAADGDVALDVAATCCCGQLSVVEQRWFIADYAHLNHLSEPLLLQQIRRWRPWLQLLMASWYQLRSEQSGDSNLIRQAKTAWLRLNRPENE